MNKYLAQSVVECKIKELGLDQKVWTSYVCGDMVMIIHYKTDHWDALPQDFAKELGEVTTEQEFFEVLESGDFAKNLM